MGHHLSRTGSICTTTSRSRRTLKSSSRGLSTGQSQTRKHPGSIPSSIGSLGFGQPNAALRGCSFRQLNANRFFHSDIRTKMASGTHHIGIIAESMVLANKPAKVSRHILKQHENPWSSYQWALNKLCIQTPTSEQQQRSGSVLCPIQFHLHSLPNQHGCLGSICAPVVLALQFHPTLRR